MQKKRNKQAKIMVGFDFDGVVFFNVARVLRPFIYFVKRYIFGIKVTKFYIPQHPLAKRIALFLHKTSYKPNAGFDLFLKMLNNPRYEVYIVTARMGFMQEDIYKILKNYDIKGLKKVIQNKKDEQPHLYKERVVKHLKLEYFVEDNWDIVKHLHETTKAKVIWIYNLTDKFFIKYNPKAPNLGEAIRMIEKEVRK